MKENNFIKKVKKKKNLSKKNSKEIRHDDPSLTPNQHHPLKKKVKRTVESILELGMLTMK